MGAKKKGGKKGKGKGKKGKKEEVKQEETGERPKLFRYTSLSVSNTQPFDRQSRLGIAFAFTVPGYPGVSRVCVWGWGMPVNQIPNQRESFGSQSFAFPGDSCGDEKRWISLSNRSKGAKRKLSSVTN